MRRSKNGATILGHAPQRPGPYRDPLAVSSSYGYIRGMRCGAIVKIPALL